MNRIKNINKFESKFKKLYKRVEAEIANAKERNDFAIMHKDYIKRYDNLEMSSECKLSLYENPIAFMKYTNGVGSDVGWFNSVLKWIIPKFIRNKMFGVDITPASDLHDVEYSLVIKFKTLLDGLSFKNRADRAFKDNMDYLIREDKGRDYFDHLRFVKSRLYLCGVGTFGNASFWSNKIKPKI